MIEYIFYFYEGVTLGWIISALILFIFNPTEFFKFIDDGGKFNGSR
jgi:hypothetical protein